MSKIESLSLNNIEQNYSTSSNKMNNLANNNSNLNPNASILMYDDTTKPSNLSFINTNDNQRTELIDVVLIIIPKYEKELIKDVKVIMKENDDIDLYELLKTLKGLGFPIEKNMISYYSYSSDIYVYCGNDPLPINFVIPSREILHENDKLQITLRIRQIVNLYNIYGDSIGESDNLKIESHDGQISEKKQKRTKERKIGQILDKVYTWRKYYSGYTDPQTGQTIKMSLEEAAQKVGISKKSLDDYLLQIRFGKKYGFNFNDHYNDRVGVLRAFVKKHKSLSEKHGDTEGEFPSKDFTNLIKKKDKRKKRNPNEDTKSQRTVENSTNNSGKLNNKSKKLRKMI